MGGQNRIEMARLPRAVREEVDAEFSQQALERCRANLDVLLSQNHAHVQAYVNDTELVAETDAVSFPSLEVLTGEYYVDSIHCHGIDGASIVTVDSLLLGRETRKYRAGEALGLWCHFELVDGVLVFEFLNVDSRAV